MRQRVRRARSRPATRGTTRIRSGRPDGSRIAFVSDRTGKEFDEGHNSDIWTVPATGGSLTKVSDSNERDSSPIWSPDGKSIAFVSAEDEDAPQQLYVTASTGAGTPRMVAKSLDLLPGNLQWAENGKAIYFDTGVKGELHVFRVDVATGAVTQATHGPRGVRASNVSPTSRQDGLPRERLSASGRHLHRGARRDERAEADGCERGTVENARSRRPSSG